MMEHVKTCSFMFYISIGTSIFGMLLYHGLAGALDLSMKASLVAAGSSITCTAAGRRLLSFLSQDAASRLTAALFETKM